MTYADALITLTDAECDRMDVLERDNVLVRMAIRTCGDYQVDPSALKRMESTDVALLQKAALAPTGWYELVERCPFCGSREDNPKHDVEVC